MTYLRLGLIFVLSFVIPLVLVPLLIGFPFLGISQESWFTTMGLLFVFKVAIIFLAIVTPRPIETLEIKREIGRGGGAYKKASRVRKAGETIFGSIKRQ